MNPYDQIHEIEWREEIRITEKVTEDMGELGKALGTTYTRHGGYRTCKGRVRVKINLDRLIKEMGRSALTNKGRKSQDGYILVTGIKGPEEVSREEVKGTI